MFDLETLRSEDGEAKRKKYLFFWGHQPPNDGSIGLSCFSQWYPASFEVDGVFYPTAEHWMMAEKARLFGDHSALESILRSVSPSQAKQIGRQVKPFDDKRWKANARGIVVAGNRHKFDQNEDLRTFLLGTSDKVLVEASPYDRLWGIGLKKDHRDAKQPRTWRGQNWLGFALMTVREQLRNGGDGADR